MVGVGGIGLQRGNKDSIHVVVEVNCNCEVGSDSSSGDSNLSQDAPA